MLKPNCQPTALTWVCYGLISLRRFDFPARYDIAYPFHSDASQSREDPVSPSDNRGAGVVHLHDQVENLHKSYGSLGRWMAFRRSPRRRIVRFLGGERGEKTTTISRISGLLKPDSGSVGSATSMLAMPKAAKRMLGLVPQDVRCMRS